LVGYRTSIAELCLQGDLEKIKYLISISSNPDQLLVSDIFAAERGHLHVIRYLHENSLLGQKGVSNASAMNAARGNHRHVLAYYHQDLNWPYLPDEFLGALEGGHVDLLEDMIQWGVPNFGTPKVDGSLSYSIEKAAGAGHLQVLKVRHGLFLLRLLQANNWTLGTEFYCF